jgi:transposase
MQSQALDHLNRTTKDPRLRTHAHMVLLSAEQGLTVATITAIVREREATVLRWLTRDLTEGLNGWHDAPRPGRPSEVTEAYRTALLAAVRRRPRSVGLPFSLWTLHRSPCGLCNVWSITWPSTRVCGSRMRPSVAP